MGETISVSAVWNLSEDIQRLAAMLCRHRQDAEDVSQASMLKAAAHIDGFRGEASVRTWLHRVASNECAMRRRRRTDLSLQALVDDGWNDPLEIDNEPERLVLESESRREVVRAVSQLSDPYRCVLLLRDGQGLPAKDVAQILGTTVPAVKSTLTRARRKLRERLPA